MIRGGLITPLSESNEINKVNVKLPPFVRSRIKEDLYYAINFKAPSGEELQDELFTNIIARKEENIYISGYKEDILHEYFINDIYKFTGITVGEYLKLHKLDRELILNTLLRALEDIERRKKMIMDGIPTE